MVWYYLLMAIGLSAAILFGCCVVMDYSTYRNLQRRLHEQRQRKEMEEPAVSAFS
jgi:hypothetical protein